MKYCNVFYLLLHSQFGRENIETVAKQRSTEISKESTNSCRKNYKFDKVLEYDKLGCEVECTNGNFVISRDNVLLPTLQADMVVEPELQIIDKVSTIWTARTSN